jgi:hypothetical protein
MPPPIAFFTVFLVGLLTAAGFKAIREYALDLNQRETVRVTSPDRQVDAVFVEPAFKLITRESKLYLVPNGEPAPSWGAVLRVTDLNEPVKLTWTRSGMVEFTYSRGCVQGFSNFWLSDEIRASIELRLDPVTELPCSGDPTKTLVSKKSAAPEEGPRVHVTDGANTGSRS